MKTAATILTFCTAALLSLGLVTLFGFSAELKPRSPAALLLLHCVAGVVLAILAVAIDYRHLRKFSVVLYALSVGLLVAVLVVGVERNGATRWMQLGPVTFQPSELAKLSLIIVLAHYCERYRSEMGNWVRGLLVPGLIIGLVLGLVFKEPDWGTTLLLGAVGGVMLVVAGVKWRHLAPPLIAGGAVLAILLYQNPTRLGRVMSWLDVEATKDGVGYQAFQAKLALGSGGLTGRGLGNGRHHGTVPFVETDFILAILGEELGLVCSLAVVLAFAGFIGSGVYIAWNARDSFGSFLAIGITFLIGLQAFINLGVVTGLLPNKGLPLPFLSRGGSSLAMMLLAMGILLSVARHSRAPARTKQNAAELEELTFSGAC
jgi:cell division protein FtsW